MPFIKDKKFGKMQWNNEFRCWMSEMVTNEEVFQLAVHARSAFDFLALVAVYSKYEEILEKLPQIRSFAVSGVLASGQLSGRAARSKLLKRRLNDSIKLISLEIFPALNVIVRFDADFFATEKLFVEITPDGQFSDVGLEYFD
jgi:hypothetical protein